MTKKKSARGPSARSVRENTPDTPRVTMQETAVMKKPAAGHGAKIRMFESGWFGQGGSVLALGRYPRGRPLRRRVHRHDEAAAAGSRP